MKILVINGPNLQLLGQREPEIYGTLTLTQVCSELEIFASQFKNIKLEFFQSNHEGDIVDQIGNSLKANIDGIIINPAALTHTSIAIYDALKAVGIPTIEVHISNIYKREKFRTHSVSAGACVGLISGLGSKGYCHALSSLIDNIKK